MEKYVVKVMFSNISYCIEDPVANLMQRNYAYVIFGEKISYTYNKYKATRFDDYNEALFQGLGAVLGSGRRDMQGTLESIKWPYIGLPVDLKELKRLWKQIIK